MENLNKITMEVMDITPEKAQEMLFRNKLNRPLNQRRVLFYADQMKKGKWVCNNQGIAFSDNGVLLDGQTRLNAIIKSGCTIKTTVFRGWDFDTVFASYDTGKMRTPGDVLSIEGYSNTNRKSSMITSYLSLANDSESILSGNSKKTDLNLSNKDILDLYQGDIEFWDRINTISARYYSKVRFLKTGQIGGIITYLIKDKHHSEENVLKFFDSLFYGTNAPNTTIIVLRELLISDLSNNLKMQARYKLALIIKTWNAYIQKREMRLVRFNSTLESFPKFL